MRVCIDAGHYGKYNRSPVIPYYYESDMTWRLQNLLRAELESRNVQVMVSREQKDIDKNLVERGRMSEGCDLFISLHSNATSSEDVDYPVAIYLVPDEKTEADEISAELAGVLVRVVQNVMDTSQEGQTYFRLAGYDRNMDGDSTNDEYYGVLFGAHEVNTPGIILEHSFHTNARAATWLLSDSNLKRLAAAEAEAIVNYLRDRVVEPQDVMQSDTKMFRNRIGLILDTDFYAAKYSDLKDAFGDNKDLLKKHFLEYGIYEGRQGIRDFTVQTYKSRYPDLQRAFGDRSFIPYWRHYLEYGSPEGRSGKL